MNKPDRKKICKGALLFFILAAVTWYLITREYRWEEILSALRQANFLWILPAVLAMGLFVFCEGTNIGRSLSFFGHNVKLRDKIKYALTGFFFSSVTPSASGGQPMQVWAMYRDGIPVSHSSLSLLAELASFQIISAAAALIGFFMAKDQILSAAVGIRALVLIGVSLNVFLLCLLLAVIFSKSSIKGIIAVLFFLIERLFPKKARQWKRKILLWAGEYRKSAGYLRKNPGLMGKMLVTAFLQLLAFYSIPYFIYQSLGLSGFHWLTITSIQAVLYISVSALPLPGAVGVTEGGFAVLFSSIFPASVMGCAMILSRFVSFYLAVIVSGIAVFAVGTAGPSGQVRRTTGNRTANLKKNTESRHPAAFIKFLFMLK